MPKLGLVTVLFKSDNVLDGFFNSIAQQDFQDFFLYLIDNSYTESSKYFIDSLIDKYELNGKAFLINSGGNVGVAAGNNIGIKKALADAVDHVMLLNNDIEFYDVSIFSKMLKKQADYDLVVTKINYFEPSNMIWYAGGNFRIFQGLTTHFGMDEMDSGKYLMEQVVEYAPTCFMMINRIVFEKIGLMDEHYFVYFDDTDFIYRCKGTFQIIYLPDIIIYHKVSTTTGGDDSPFSIFYGHRNRLYFGVKCLPLLYKLTSFIYTNLTIIPKLFLYNSDQRKAMLKGVKEGLSLISSK